MTVRRSALLVTKNDFRLQRDGGSKRTAAVVTALESMGYQVDWVAARPFVSSVAGPSASLSGAEVLKIGRVVLRAICSASLSVLKWQSLAAIRQTVQLAARTEYDLFVVEHSQLEPYALAGMARVKCIDLHNIESELLRNFALSSSSRIESALGSYESWRMRAVERAIPRRFDIVSTVSERDADLLREEGPEPRASIVVAPNGISKEFFGVDGDRKGDVVFIGHLGWRPNVDAAEWLVESVWPLVAGVAPGLKLRLIGLSPDRRVTRLAGGAVEVYPNVPSVLPHLATASVATAPLMSAGGTRIKILEALAAGVPVVATSLGALGLEALAGDHLVIVDTPEEFASAIRRLSRLMVERGAVRQGVKSYAWEESLKPLIDVLRASELERAKP